MLVYTFGAEDGAVDVLTASWTANSYTLHFDPNGGVRSHTYRGYGDTVR